MSASGFVSRLVALTRKETRQMLRDRSNLVVGLLLPITLILLFGYGLSFDLKNVRVTVVMGDNSETARQAVSGLTGTEYIAPDWDFSLQEARRKMIDSETDAILWVPHRFSADLQSGTAELQLIVNGADSTTAQSMEGFISGAIAIPVQQVADRAGDKAAGMGNVTITQRTWFNEAGNSTWFLVPGLIVLVMTLIGAFLTSLLVAREWERGTLESLFVTPVRPLELVLSKLAPYLMIGTIDLVMCLVAARWLFDVPIRGSLPIIIFASMLYLVVSLALGLFISAVTRNQFQASQMALLTSFMPALILSGFVFDLRNLPVFIKVVSNLLPATHFMGLIKTLFMAGDYWPDIIQTSATLSLYALVLIVLTRRALRKKLD